MALNTRANYFKSAKEVEEVGLVALELVVEDRNASLCLESKSRWTPPNKKICSSILQSILPQQLHPIDLSKILVNPSLPSL
jgi:hypothetical protein